MFKSVVKIVNLTLLIFLSTVLPAFWGWHNRDIPALNLNLHRDNVECLKYSDSLNSETASDDSEGSKLSSGQVFSVPWENDEKFKEMQKAVSANILMAAFRTVLRDPLPGEEENVHLAARMLAGTVVQPGEIFSQNLKIGPYTKEKGFKEGPTYIGSRLTTTIGGGVCKIASTLYNVAILSNLQIVERHAHSMPVPYVPYGQDATVAYGARDFKFKNNTNFPVLIWAQGIDNILYIGFYGREAPPKVTWHHERLSTFKAPVIYKINRELGENEEKVIVEGMDGAVVRSWITIEKPDGSVETKQLGKSHYTSMPYVIEKGMPAANGY